jgi:hypothetical protein
MIPASCRSTQQAASTDFDWIRHKDGEWLKGDIELLRYGTLEFESEEMGSFKFDFEKIVEVRSSRMNSCLFEGDITAVGTLLIRDDFVLVGGEKEQRFDRANLVTIIPGGLKESNFWSGKVSVGISTTSGNTDQANYDGRIYIERRTLSTLVSIDYTGHYGKLEGEENINNHNIREKYQIFLSRRFYISPLVFDAYRDPIKNIDYRLTPGAGVGYYIFDRGDLEWNVDGLLGYSYTRYDSVQAGEDKSDDTVAVIAVSDLEMDLTKDVDLELDYSIQYPLEGGQSPNHHALAGVSIELNDILDLNVSGTWDRVGSPERDSSGVLPEKNDYRLTVGLEIDF